MDLEEPLNKGIGEAPTHANSGWQAKHVVVTLRRSVGQFTEEDTSGDESQMFGLSGPQTSE